MLDTKNVLHNMLAHMLVCLLGSDEGMYMNTCALYVSSTEVVAYVQNLGSPPPYFTLLSRLRTSVAIRPIVPSEKLKINTVSMHNAVTW